MTGSNLKRPVRLVGLAAAASLVFGLAACGSNDAGTAKNGEEGLEKIRITATLMDTLPFMAALKIADDRGYFEAEGVEVEFASAAGGGNTLRSLSTGDTDLSIGSPAASVLAAQTDSNVEIVSLWAPRNGFYWIGPKKITDLDGTKIGGSVPGSTVNLLLAGVEEESSVKFKEIVPAGGMGENWVAAKSGHIVGGWAMEPYVTQQISNENAEIVIDGPDLIPWFPADMVVVNKEWASKNPEAVKGFFKASSKVFDDFINDTAKVATELSAIMGIDAGIIEKSITESPVQAKDIYSYKTVPEALDTVSKLMEAANQVKKPIEWAPIFNQDYLPDNMRATFQ